MKKHLYILLLFAFGMMAAQVSVTGQKAEFQLSGYANSVRVLYTPDKMLIRYTDEYFSQKECLLDINSANQILLRDEMMAGFDAALSSMQIEISGIEMEILYRPRKAGKQAALVLPNGMTRFLTAQQWSDVFTGLNEYPEEYTEYTETGEIEVTEPKSIDEVASLLNSLTLGDNAFEIRLGREDTSFTLQVSRVPFGATIYWGDGKSQKITEPGDYRHNYPAPGKYEIVVKGEYDMDYSRGNDGYKITEMLNGGTIGAGSDFTRTNIN